MSWFSSFMHPGKPYQQAGETERGYFNQGQQQLSPYIQQGQQAGQGLNDMYSKLMNPGQLQDEWSKGYETSPYAQQLQQQAQTGGMDAASAMGLGGSSAALSNIQHGSSNIMQADRQNYMKDMMDKYLAGMGLGQNMYGIGAGAAGQSANMNQQMGQDQANLKYNQQAAGGNMLSGLFGGLAGLGGAALGGPMGKQLGGWIGNKIGGQ